MMERHVLYVCTTVVFIIFNVMSCNRNDIRQKIENPNNFERTLVRNLDDLHNQHKKMYISIVTIPGIHFNKYYETKNHESLSSGF